LYLVLIQKNHYVFYPDGYRRVIDMKIFSKIKRPSDDEIWFDGNKKVCCKRGNELDRVESIWWPPLQYSINTVTHRDLRRFDESYGFSSNISYSSEK